ncbi:MAG: class I SAM-dependent DNA methyltransferase [Corynebacterium sp.]|uniref:DNA methyltransferase n=1 Tax=Corynebacterium sp. TaxID=1720 RepID=UPI0026DF9CC3|nr:DNA methyltransferase [Corynebacterium sp.]MDO5669053.1 class I SAM-dependent DNA methyltransferase [Corynebacterium sp.]
MVATTSPLLTHNQRVSAAKEFVERWQGIGSEKSDTHKFWLDLCTNVLGMKEITTAVLFEGRTTYGGFIDVRIPDAKTFIEQKSLGVDLDKPDTRQGHMVTPFEQVKNYVDSQPNSQRPDMVIVCNFGEFRLHDLDVERPEENYVSFTLEELPEQLHLLDFLVAPQTQRAIREKEVSLAAGDLVGRLYEGLAGLYADPDSPQVQHALNVLSVRLVFCLFAEDAGVFNKNALRDYLEPLPANFMHMALDQLFRILDTPLEERSPYDREQFSGFPYVNGGLFREQNVEIPVFTEDLKTLLVRDISHSHDWSRISPTIFGGVFESTLNPETRRSGGMHYTSPDNIHKVIDPLFLDDLTVELENILIANGGGGDVKRRNNLKRFQDKLAGLTFFDPACGSGNFLTETYISLRRLENKVLTEIQRGQAVLDVGQESPIKVKVSQFYGIEINDFAVSVAQTALWIAQLQADLETEMVTSGRVDALPLKDAPGIVHGNALQVEWESVLEPERCNYIIGNPPFLGYSNLSDDQKAERAVIFGKSGGVLDYVACWYKLAADYMKGTKIEAALVSTNSITQGQQVQPLWEPLLSRGLFINFAHRTFSWSNEAADYAAVHVVIVGFSYVERKDKLLFAYRGRELERVDHPKHINGYLVDAPNVYVTRRSKPISAVPEMIAGGKPTDGGHLLLSRSERDELVKKEPAAEKWIRPFSMGAEFIRGIERFCLWLVDCPPHELKTVPMVLNRVQQVREMRLSSKKVATQKKASTPWLFDEIRYDGDGDYLAVPAVSSERREYIPIGFVTEGMIPGNKLYFVPNATVYDFGIVASRVHNAWMRTVAGRLKSDYNYANTIVYNNFVWPEVDDQQRAEIEAAAQAVLEARAAYPDAALKDFYDPDHGWLFPQLVAAHQALDSAVEKAYGLEPGCEEKVIVEHLFQLYGEAVQA